MSEGRVVHLDAKVHMDGQSEAAVTLTETPQGDYVVAVRPKGKRIVYTGLLSVIVTSRGRLLVRVVCAVFDRYLRTSQARAEYSKVI